jgi:LEA14-like dessication related protein
MITRILAFTILLAVTACVDYKEVEFISLENAELNKISPNGIEADLWVKIKNPNDYKIKVETKVYKTSIIVSLPADGNIDLGMIMLMSGGKITLGLKGEIIGKAKGISKTVPVDFTESVSI